MAYTPTVWSENDLITAEKLNNIENALGSQVLNLGEINLEEIFSGGNITASYFKEITLTEEQLNTLSSGNVEAVLFNANFGATFGNTPISIILNKDTWCNADNFGSEANFKTLSPWGEFELRVQINSAVEYEAYLFYDTNQTSNTVLEDTLTLDSEEASGTIALNLIQQEKLEQLKIKYVTFSSIKYAASGPMYKLPFIVYQGNKYYFELTSLNYTENQLSLLKVTCVLSPNESKDTNGYYFYDYLITENTQNINLS